MTNENLPIVEDKSLSLVEMLSKEAVIKENDLQLLSDSKQFIVDTYKSVPMYRPLVIKLFGVLNNGDFPTVDSKFWQCKVEAEVHANELIRDLHDLELQKVQIDRSKFLLTKIIKKVQTESDGDIRVEVEFDIKEQKTLISKKQFELLQLQKKIKYRIEEVVHWRQIAGKLEKDKSFGNQNYAQMLADSLCAKWDNQIKNDPKLDEHQKSNMIKQVEMMKQLSTDVSKVKNQ